MGSKSFEKGYGYPEGFCLDTSAQQTPLLNRHLSLTTIGALSMDGFDYYVTGHEQQQNSAWNNEGSPCTTLVQHCTADKDQQLNRHVQDMMVNRLMMKTIDKASLPVEEQRHQYSTDRAC